VGGANVFEFNALYDFDLYHERYSIYNLYAFINSFDLSRSIARSGFDTFVCFNVGYVLLHQKMAAVRASEAAMEQWLVADAKASDLGTGCTFPAFATWKLLSALEFSRMAGARNISWQTVETRIRASPVQLSMRYESETGQVVTCLSIDSLVQMAQAVLILQPPNCVQRDDITAFIPTPGEWTHVTSIVRPMFLVTSFFSRQLPTRR
jgi:hypothetical protein